jgi:hypothetical protein
VHAARQRGEGCVHIHTPPEQASPGPYYDEGLPLVRVEGRYVVAAPVTFPQHWKVYGH